MTPWHPWAVFKDFMGNIWCLLEHFPTHWTLAHPGPYAYIPGTFSEHVAQMLTQFPVWRCERCGREWLEQEGKYTAMTHRHLDTARAQLRPNCQ